MRRRARSRFASSCRPRPAVTTATSLHASIVSPRFSNEGILLIRRLVYVALFIEIGLLLIVLPWSTFWERNYFVFVWPVLRPVITNHFVRGAITGLGFVNVFAGFAELAPVFEVRASGDVPFHDADTQVGP